MLLLFCIFYKNHNVIMVRENNDYIVILRIYWL